LNIKQKINWLHEKIFWHWASDAMFIFLKDLWYVTLAWIFAKALMWISRVYWWNIAWEEAYWTFALLISFVMLLIYPMNIFVYWTSRLIAENKDENEKWKYFSSVFWIIVFILPIFIFIYWFFGKEISIFFWFHHSLMIWILIFVWIWYLMSFFESVLASYDNFKLQSIFSSTAHFIYFVIFIILSIYFQNFFLFLYSYLSLLLIQLIFYWFYLIPKIKLLIDFEKLKEIYSYWFLLFLITGFQVLMINIDKIAINKFLDTATVWLYQAYYDSSIIITWTILTMLIQVLWVKLFMQKNKKPIFEKFKKISKLLLILDILFLPILIFLIVKFWYNYQINFSLIIWFTILTVISNKLYLWKTLLQSLDKNIYKKTLKLYVILLVLNIIWNFTLVPVFGILAAIGTTIFVDSLAFGFSYFWIKEKLNSLGLD